MYADVDPSYSFFMFWPEMTHKSDLQNFGGPASGTFSVSGQGRARVQFELTPKDFIAHNTAFLILSDFSRGGWLISLPMIRSWINDIPSI